MICEAGVIWKRTPGATFSPLKSSAAIRRSSMRALVHEPRNATSIFVPSTSSTGLRFAGFDGHATCGPMPSTSKVNVFTNVASSSDRIGSNRAPVWARYSFVIGSASIMPTFAPISVVMLHRTKRSFIGKAFTVEPVNSTAAYRAASSPVVPITFRMTSFAPVRSPSVPRMSTRIVSGTRSHSCPFAITAAVSIVPISLNGSRARASISCMYNRSTSPSTIWPGRTDSTWLARASIFSDIVWPVIEIGGCTGATRPINMAMDGPKALREARNPGADGDEFEAERGVRDALPDLGLHVARDPDRARRRTAVLVRIAAVRRRGHRAGPARGHLPVEVAAEPDGVGARRIRRDRPLHRGLRAHLLGREQRRAQWPLRDPVRDLSPPDRPRGQRIPQGGTLHGPETARHQRGVRRGRPDLSQPARDRGTRAGVPHALDRARRDVRGVRHRGGEAVGSRHRTDQFQRGGDGGRCRRPGHAVAHHTRAVGNPHVASGPRRHSLPRDCRIRRHVRCVAVAPEGDARDLALLHRVDHSDRGRLAWSGPR